MKWSKWRLTRNPRSRLLQLLFEVVELKLNRSREVQQSIKLRDARRENKYHLVQNYNNDLIRKSLKSQNNHNRLNIKEHKANIHLESITKRLQELNKKKAAQKVGSAAPLKSLTAHRRKEDLEIDLANPIEAMEKAGLKDRGSNFSYVGNTQSSNITQNSNMSFSTSKSNKAESIKEKKKELVLPTSHKMMIKNTLMQRFKNKTTTKDSNTSNRSSFSRDAQSNKLAPRPTSEQEVTARLEDRILHLTLNGAKHNTNLVQINNYINKPHREGSESAGLADSKSHRMSTNSNSSSVYSIKLQKLRRPESTNSKELDAQVERKSRTNAQIPVPLQSKKFPFAEPMLATIQNKNVLSLTQNLLQKRNRHE